LPPPANQDQRRVLPPSNPRPGDIITELRMEVGTEAAGSGAGAAMPSAARPSAGSFQGRGSSQLSRRQDDGLLETAAGTGASVPRSLDRSSLLPLNKPDLVTRTSGQQQDLPHDLDSIAQEAMVEDVIIRDAFKEENSIVIKWDSETLNILGFRVIYRLFGTPQFKQGPPLAPSEREFKIKNVPDSVSHGPNNCKDIKPNVVFTGV
jgi:hypothetical protein